MTTFADSLVDYDLAQRLKDINAVLRSPSTSVVERYAGISELGLFKDERKVDVLTVGLFDENPAVRLLAASVLGTTYGLAETSNLVTELLDHDGELLRSALLYQEQKHLQALLDKLTQVMRQKRLVTVEGESVDYDRRHGLRILSLLGHRLRQLQDETGDKEANPLKEWLEDQDNRQILRWIREALDNSKDVFCRRNAILVFGELNLKISLDMPAFELILDILDRPENRNNYLVTWDCIRATTTLVQQEPKLRNQFVSILRQFFGTRTYALEDIEVAREHQYYTRLHCIEALRDLAEFSTIEQLLRDGKQGGFFRMMDIDAARKASNLAKVNLIKAFLQLYRQEAEDATQLTDRQRTIVIYVSEWVGSRLGSVRTAAINFFADIPNARQALEYLLQSANNTEQQVSSLLAQLETPDASDKAKKTLYNELSELLSDRQQLSRVFGTILSKAPLDDTDWKPIQERVYQLLRLWGLQQIQTSNEQFLRNAKKAAIESLWTLYTLSVCTNIEQQSVTLTTDDLHTLLIREQTPDFRSVLELFRAWNTREQFLNELSLIATGRDDKFVSTCAMIELIIQTNGHGIDVPDTVDYLAQKLLHLDRSKEQMDDRLIARFIPVLASMETPRATSLIESLLSHGDVDLSIQMRLREHLSDYQCYELRNLLDETLHRNLIEHHRPLLPRLRLDYINLLRAGSYRQRAGQDGELVHHGRALSEFQKAVLDKLHTLKEDYREVDLPILYPLMAEITASDVAPHDLAPVVAFNELAPESISSILYAKRVPDPDNTVVKAYLRTQQFTNAWVFLDRSISDTEIARTIYNSIDRRKHKRNKETFYASDLTKPIVVGRVVSVDADGVQVDVGLQKIQPLVYKSDMIQDSDDSSKNWQEYASELLGSVKTFRIDMLTIAQQQGELAIVNLKLTCKDIQPSKRDIIAGSVLQARVKYIESRPPRPGVVFEASGHDIYVPLQELSWCPTKEWMQTNWRTAFEDRRDEVFVLRRIGSGWSLREAEPNLQRFTRLLYEKGTTPFKLVYVEQSDSGHVFEISPGQNCYIPADRLVKRYLESEQLQFLFPNQSLGSGDVLCVQFAERTEHGQSEALLNVDSIEQNLFRGSSLSQGAHIHGELIYLDLDQLSGELRPAASQLKDFKIFINKLPVQDPSAGIAVGAEVNGQIVQIDPYQRCIYLDYIMKMQDELEVGQIYQCKVTKTPQPSDYALQLRHANVFGMIEERQITYRHTPVLDWFQFGDIVEAHLLEPVEWEQRFDERVTPKRPNEMITQLGLAVGNVTQGTVTSFSQGQVVAVRKDGSAFNFKLRDDLNFRGKEPKIYVGNRVRFTSEANNDLRLTVESPRAAFSMLANINKESNWVKFHEVLQPDVLVRCFFVYRVGKNLLFEKEDRPGKLFALPVSYVNQSLGNIPIATMGWRRTQQDGIEVVRAGTEQMPIPLEMGDMLTLIYHAQENLVELNAFELGPLHLAAHPWLMKPGQQDSLTLIGSVIRTRVENGRRVALSHVLTDNQRIALRQGIIGFYPINNMSEEEQNRLLDGDGLPDGTEVAVMIDRPPEFRNGRLELPKLKTIYVAPDEIEEAIEPDQLDLPQKLAELKHKWAERPHETFDGTIETYDNRCESFQVVLDELADYGEFRCQLPVDKVSYSLVTDTRSIKIFGSDRRQTFTIGNVTVEETKVELSLIDNPRTDIDDVASTHSWYEGKILTRTTFIGNNGVGLVSVEITPGLLINVQIERFTVEGFPFHSQSAELQVGDQLTLRIGKAKEGVCLDVVAVQPSRLRLLSNERRVFFGRLADRIGDSVRLELQGYNYTHCYLETEFTGQAEKFSDHDLFRLTRYVGRTLYYRPVSLLELKQGDILHVTFQEIAGERRDLMRVTFGKGRSGTIYKTDFSFHPHFSLEELNAKPGDEFDAIIRTDVTDPSFVRLSRKDLPTYRLNYLLEGRLPDKIKQKPFFRVVLVRCSANTFEVEVEPGLVVRVPLDRIEIDRNIQFQPSELSGTLRPGDVLQIKLIQRTAYEAVLRLLGITKSLSHYLKQDMLVRAYFRNINREGAWIFELPEYGDRVGKISNPSKLIAGLFSRDFMLAIAQIPLDPTQAIPLRQRTMFDPQLLLRIEEVMADRIQVRYENGGLNYLYSRDATYHIDHRVSYLQQKLYPNQVILASRIPGLPNREYHLSLNANPPTQITTLRSAIGNTLELTYVRTESNEHIFELMPGQMVTVPTSSLYFRGYPMFDLGRFLPGDVFLVKVEASSEVGIDEVRLAVLCLNLSLLHTLHLYQFVHCEVIEIIPNAPGLVVRSGSLEYFIFENNLMRGHSINTYPVGSWFWLQVRRLDRSQQFMELYEVKPPMLAQLKDTPEPGKRIHPLLLRGQICRPHDPRSTDVVVLGTRLKLWRESLVWSNPNQHSFTVDDVVPPDETEILIEISVDRDGEYRANPKIAYARTVIPELEKRKDSLVQMQVEQINWDKRTVKHVLANIDGVRILLNQSDLVCGASSDEAVVEAGMWMAVRIVDIDRSRLTGQTLLANNCAANRILEDMPRGMLFHAMVEYTLLNGLVFNYQGALGYLSNKELAWHSAVTAQKIYAPGDPIAVYKANHSDEGFLFHCKQRSQIGRMQKGQEITATIFRVLDDGYCLTIGEMLAFVPRNDIHPEQQMFWIPQNQVTLQVESINMQHLMLELRPASNSKTASYNTSTLVLNLRDSVELHYMVSLRRLQEALKQRDFGISLKQFSEIESSSITKPGPLTLAKSTESTPEQFFIKLLNSEQISSDYRIIRRLLAWLCSQAVYQPLWKRLAQHPIRDEENREIVHILNQVASVLTGNLSRGNRSDLTARSGYAIGIIALMDNPPFTISPPEAVEYLLMAYAKDKALDIQIALLLMYDKLQAAEQRSTLLHQIVYRIAQNPQWLLKLPEYLLLDTGSYSPEIKRSVPGVGRKLAELGNEIETVMSRYLNEDAESRLSDLADKIYAAGGEIPELDLNLAICYLLRYDFERALTSLDRCERILTKDSNRDHFPVAWSAYFQLKMYIYFHLGNYILLQDEVEKFTQHHINDPALQTWLGYLFLASGHLALSQQIALHPRQPSHSYPELQLLTLYWRDRQLPKVAILEGIDRLHTLVFNDRTNWTQLALRPRLFPANLTHENEFRILIDAAKHYDAADYALHQYKTRPTLDAWPGDRTVAAGLADLALRMNAVQDQQAIIHKHFTIARRRSEDEAVRFVVNFCGDWLLLNDLKRIIRDNPQVSRSGADRQSDDELTRYLAIANGLLLNPPTVPTVEQFPAQALRKLISTWMKSEQTGSNAGKNLMELLKHNHILRRLCWRRSDLRSYIWQVFDQCIDYGALQTDDNLDLVSFSDIIFHLLTMHLRRLALESIESMQKRFQPDSLEVSYLRALIQFIEAQSYTELNDSLPFVMTQPQQRSLEIYENRTLRAAAIRALDLLTKFPDPDQQIGACLLLGELEEASQHYVKANQLYRSIAFARDHATDLARLTASFRLLRLSAVMNEDYWHGIGLEVGNNWQVREKSLGRLLVPLAELIGSVQSWRERAILVSCLTRLELIIKEWADTSHYDQVQIKALLYQMHQIPQGHSYVQILYAILVGAIPLTGWKPALIEEFLSLFFDFALVNRLEDLKSLVSATLAASITQAEVQARSGKDLEGNRYYALQTVQTRMDNLTCWLLPQQLAENPDQIEPCAQAVVNFLAGGHRLAQQLFANATKVLIEIFGLTNEKYGSASIRLIEEVQLARGDWRSAAQRLNSMPNSDVRDELLILILFHYMKKKDNAAISYLKQQLTVPTKRHDVNELIRLWEMSTNTHNDILQTADEITHVLQLLRHFHQDELAFQYLGNVLEQSSSATAEYEKHWNQYLEYAIRGLAPLPVVIQIVEHAITFATENASVAEQDIVGYVSHYELTTDAMMIEFLVKLADHRLCLNYDLVLNELVIVRRILDTSRISSDIGKD